MFFCDFSTYSFIIFSGTTVRGSQSTTQGKIANLTNRPAIPGCQLVTRARLFSGFSIHSVAQRVFDPFLDAVELLFLSHVTRDWAQRGEWPYTSSRSWAVHSADRRGPHGLVLRRTQCWAGLGHV